LAGSVVLDC